MIKFHFLLVGSMNWEYANIAEHFIPGTTFSKVDDQSYHIVISDGEILSIDDQHPWRPLTQDEWRWCGLDSISTHYLGQIAGTAILAEEVDSDVEEPPGYEFDTLWSFLMAVDQPVFYLKSQPVCKMSQQWL